MSYDVVEAALLTVIKLHADYDAANASRGDYRQVGHGKARVAVLTYGGHSRREITLGLEVLVWDILIDLFIPWPGQQTTLDSNFLAERQKIIDQIAKYPRFNGAAGVLKAMVLTGEEPELLTPVNSAYRGQRLHCEVEELVDPGRLE